MTYRSIFVSDCHLGLTESHAHELSVFLRQSDFETLYIVGDLFDLWGMKLHPSWHEQNTELIATLLELAKTKKIIYIIGNHDGALGQFAGKMYGGVLLSKQEDYTTVLGKRLVVLHGNIFDSIVTAHATLSVLGTWVNNVLLALDPFVTWIRHLFGHDQYWSFAGYIKRKVRNEAYVNSFKRLLIQYAKKNGYDGVICGHLHRPSIEVIDDVLYYNDGDVITSLTALVEYTDGKFDLVNFGS